LRDGEIAVGIDIAAEPNMAVAGGVGDCAYYRSISIPIPIPIPVGMTQGLAPKPLPSALGSVSLTQRLDRGV